MSIANQPTGRDARGMGILTESKFQASSRDRRIDFWRGLCLIDMVLVHLYYENVQMGQLGKFLGEYTRFAAGGFVFVAGMAIGAIFLPKARRPEQRGETYRRLWLRSLRILGWQFVVATAWVDLMVWRGTHQPVSGMGQLLRDVLLFREGGDLLPLYVLLIAIAPLLLEIRRRTLGWLALAGGSITVFVFGRYHIYVLPQGNFPPLLWQLVFISGLLCGSVLKRYDALSFRTKLSMSIVFWLAFAVLFWCEYWSVFGLPAFPIRPVFSKVPLSPAEFLRYLTMTLGLVTGTDLIWSWLGGTNFVAFTATLGRSALPVYVAHTFLIEFSGWLATAWWGIGAWQILFVPVCLVLLWLLALALQWHGRRPPPGQDWPMSAASRAT